ncbi:hypothetical protein F0L68_25510 [Solihabitans fulvus]|uniref:Uncharacterized protein n=2 Tax=Solihabitans fulvus TaxID=1892852 RepID=A0A5B2X1P9_9PSEU|nr:hypothetical protein F0L68_25510 [Solihabitans fulvus]
MRFQDPELTKPREPTLAEKRARLRAEEEQEQAAVVEQAAADRKGKVRRRVMIGSGVTVGVVALIAVGYAAASPNEVTAKCTASGDKVAEDNYCDPDFVNSHGGHITNGVIFWPVGSPYGQYHYYYGGTGSIGQTAVGGSTTKPDGATIKTNSGKTIERGGFGIKSGGKSGGS